MLIYSGQYFFLCFLQSWAWRAINIVNFAIGFDLPIKKCIYIITGFYTEHRCATKCEDLA